MYHSKLLIIKSILLLVDSLVSPTPTPTPAHTHIVSLSLSISETHNVPPSGAPDCPGAATGQCVCKCDPGPGGVGDQ